MKWLKLGFQAVIAIVLSIAAWQAFGPAIYIAMASGLALLAGIAIVIRGVRDVLVDPEQHSPGWFVLSIFIALMLGLLWPMLPIAFAWGGVKRDDGASPSIQRGPCSERRTDEGA